MVWEPVLPTDWYRPTRQTLSRVPDPRARQFWDKHHLIASQLKQQLNGNGPHCCETDSGILWDVVALYSQGSRWEDSTPVLDDGPIYRVAPELNRMMSNLISGDG